MHFDFYEQFKSYSNVELLKILQQPDDYQPQALEAASRILEERKVNFTEPTEPEIKRYTLKGHTTDLLDSFVLQEEETKSVKWLNVFLLLVAVEYLWGTYNLIRSTTGLIFCRDCTFEPILFIILLMNTAYTPFVLYLMMKRKSWGWILMFFMTCFGAGTRIRELATFYQFVSLDTVEGIMFILMTILKGAFAYFLWRKEVRDLFHINREKKLWTTFAVICVLGITFIYKYGMERSQGVYNLF